MKLNTAPGIEVTVQVGGQALQEYGDPDNPIFDDSDSGTQYVEVVAGANFVVHCHIMRSGLECEAGDRLMFKVLIDGEMASSQIFPVFSRATYNWGVKGKTSDVNGQSVLERFNFAPLKTDDGPLLDRNPKDFVKLGQIEVQCTFVHSSGVTKPANSAKMPFRANADEKLPEKCLKGRAISHRASLGNHEPTTRLYSVSDLSYPYGKSPFATYIFKYRSRQDLQIEDIIPRSPSPVPLEDRDPETLTLAEARELLRRQRANGDGLAQIKKETEVKVKKEKRDREKRDRDAFRESSGDGDGNGDDDVVFEGRRNKRARSANDSGVEIIDLTD